MAGQGVTAATPREPGPAVPPTAGLCRTGAGELAKGWGDWPEGGGEWTGGGRRAWGDGADGGEVGGGDEWLEE